MKNLIQNIFFVAIFSLLLIDCNKPMKTKIDDQRNIEADQTGKKLISDIRDELKGFVFTCGSGCAMQYNTTKIEKVANSYQVSFKVKMFVDENVDDEFEEVLIFKFNALNKLTSVHSEDSTVDLLAESPISGIESLKVFGEHLKQSKY